jgi:hypothetical protein
VTSLFPDPDGLKYRHLFQDRVQVPTSADGAFSVLDRIDWTAVYTRKAHGTGLVPNWFFNDPYGMNGTIFLANPAACAIFCGIKLFGIHGKAIE